MENIISILILVSIFLTVLDIHDLVRELKENIDKIK
jgi:hypothetical protein